jgi:hypothetical protein
MRTSLVTIFVIHMVACVHLLADGESAASQPAPADTSPADIMWQNLQSRLSLHAPLRQQQATNATPSDAASSVRGAGSMQRARFQPRQPLAEPAKRRPAQTDWRAIAQESREFITRHPDSRHTGDARKLELTAELSLARGKGLVAPDVQSRVTAYLADQSVPPAARYEIGVLAKEASEDNSKIHTHADSTRVRIRHARELTQEFPADPRGYGYMLAVAKAGDSALALKTAAELLDSDAPGNIKEEAARLAAQRNMEGKRLEVDGLNIREHRGFPLVIYTWSAQRTDVLRLVKRAQSVSGIKWLGINVDADSAAAEKLARALKLPGRQYYDGPGGPLLAQLRVQTPMSVYLVNAEGKLADVLGHMYLTAKLTALAGKTNSPVENGGAE